jgi:hypothetical protein
LSTAHLDYLWAVLFKWGHCVKIDMAYFASVEGSMTSPDGKIFMLHVKRETGTELFLGFPHSEISNIIENAAMQSGNGKDKTGRKVSTAFTTTSFQLGRGEHGEAVLTMVVGKTGKVSFALPADMPGQLGQALRKLAN